jgi:hypothetical protein
MFTSVAVLCCITVFVILLKLCKKTHSFCIESKLFRLLCEIGPEDFCKPDLFMDFRPEDRPVKRKLFKASKRNLDDSFDSDDEHYYDQEIRNIELSTSSIGELLARTSKIALRDSKQGPRLQDYFDEIYKRLVIKIGTIEINQRPIPHANSPPDNKENIQGKTAIEHLEDISVDEKELDKATTKHIELINTLEEKLNIAISRYTNQNKTPTRFGFPPSPGSEDAFRPSQDDSELPSEEDDHLASTPSPKTIGSTPRRPRSLPIPIVQVAPQTNHIRHRKRQSDSPDHDLDLAAGSLLALSDSHYEPPMSCIQVLRETLV